MHEITIGNINKRQLHLRFFVPFEFLSWHNSEWRLDWRELFKPRNWWKSVFRRSGWSLWQRHCWHGTHRCYCPHGHALDVGITIAGWGFIMFYSRYSGEIPCTCDKVLAELEEQRR